MALFDFFSRKPAIDGPEALADFIDRNAAFLMQKGIYEYARARAGHYAKVLFAEPGFQTAIEKARWQAFPLGLAMMAELVDTVLSDTAPEDRPAFLPGIGRLALSVFDRYPAPAALSGGAWAQQRADLALRLSHVGLHPPKRAIDIPEPYAEPYFALMPIDEKLRGRDFPTTRNYLRVTLSNIRDELERGLDAAALRASLQAGPW